jgi:molybdate transport system substrate-binding protein
MTKRVAALGFLAGVLLARPLAAAEITVLSAGAVEPGLEAAAAAFEKQTGHVVKITFETVPQIRARLIGGEMADVVIASPAVLDELAGKKRVESERVTVGRVGMGVAVRAGSTEPDISSVDALKRTVLAADSLVFSRGSSGVYFEGLLKKLGLYAQVEGKIVRFPDGASVFEHVLQGKGSDVSFGQLTEIGLYRSKGLTLVGPLPADAQNYTSYAGAPMVTRPNAEVARAFVRYLDSAAGRALFAAAGIEQ